MQSVVSITKLIHIIFLLVLWEICHIIVGVNEF